MRSSISSYLGYFAFNRESEELEKQLQYNYFGAEFEPRLSVTPGPLPSQPRIHVLQSTRSATSLRQACLMTSYARIRQIFVSEYSSGFYGTALRVETRSN